MSVRFASIAARDAAATAVFLRQWREYYRAKGLNRLLGPTPQQTRISLVVNKRMMQFGWRDFVLDDVSLLVCEAGGYTVVFFDQSLNDGQGGFLQAVATLTMDERCKLGARRRVREPFVRGLIAAARQQPQPTRTRA